jgi:hypothetical protein
MSEVYHDTPNPTTKICTKCHIEKPLVHFSAQRSNKDGLRNHCRSCASIAFKEHASKHPRKQRNQPLPVPPGVTSKVCTFCGVEKPLTSFSKSNHERYGVKARCKMCVSEQEKLKRQRNAIPRPLPPNSKTCTICGDKKPCDDFYKGSSRCKKCTLNREKLKRFQKKNAERVQLPLLIFSRVCTKCKMEKPIDEFPPNKYLPHGIHSRCKICMAEDVQQRASKITESILPFSKLCGKCGVEKPLDQFPISNGYGKYGRSSVCSECSSKRFQENKEKYMATNALWRKNNPLKDRKRAQNYAARKKNAQQIGEIDYARILERDGLWCYICKQDILAYQKMHFDHVVPLARGGSHSEDNLKPTHAQCNCRKQDRLFSELTEYDRRGPDA